MCLIVLALRQTHRSAPTQSLFRLLDSQDQFGDLFRHASQEAVLPGKDSVVFPLTDR